MKNAASYRGRLVDIASCADRRAQTLRLLEGAAKRLSGLPAGLVRQAKESAERRILEHAFFAQFAYVRLVETVVDGLEITPGDRRSAVELAKRVCAQSLQNRCSFQPGTRVRLKSSPNVMAIVAGGKPVGYREENGWSYLLNRPIIAEPGRIDLLWTVRTDSTGIGQSRAEDWMPA